MLDLFQVLGFNTPVSLSVLNARYKELAKQYHPDVNPEAGDRFKLINASYQQLKKLDPSVFPQEEPKKKKSSVSVKKKADETIFRVFESNKSHTYYIHYPDGLLIKNTRFYFMIDGREYRTFIDKQVKLPWIMTVRDDYRNETYMFHFLEVPRY